MACIVYSCLCDFVRAQCTVLSGGMLSQENVKFIPYESPSEAVREHHNHETFVSITQAIDRIVVSQSPFPSESAFVFEAQLQNCLLGAAKELQI